MQRGEQVPYEGCTDARYFAITKSCVWETSLLVDFEAQALNSHTGFARNPESRIQNTEYRWSPDPHGSPKMCVTEPRELGIQNPESGIQNTDGAPTHMVLLRCVSLSVL